MPKMTVRVILKSGVEFSIKCDKFTLTRNGFQQVTGYNIEGITENKPVYLDFEQVAAVVRVFADEKLETDDAPEEKRLFTETPKFQGRYRDHLKEQGKINIKYQEAIDDHEHRITVLEAKERDV